MAEQYNSSHTGAIIDEKIQSLIDFGNIYEGHLSPGLLYENEQHQESIIDNRGTPIPGGGYTYEFDYDENYNTTRYSVIGNICFITFHLKINVTIASNIDQNKFAILKGLPFNSLYDTSFSIYELYNLKDFNSDSFTQFGAITVQSGKNYVRLECENGKKATSWQLGETWVGGSGFYFIQR